MKVLVADDDAVSRALLQLILGKLGYEPVITSSGREALGVIKKEEIPILLTDWQMPDLDGPEVCRRLRAPGRRIYTYVILVTTLSRKNKLLEGIDAGADDFLTKPIDIDELSARLRVAERIVGLQKEMRQMEGLLSICMHCKKIREGKEWVQVDHYIAQHTATTFSHGLCPDCLKKQIAD